MFSRAGNGRSSSSFHPAPLISPAAKLFGIILK